MFTRNQPGSSVPAIGTALSTSRAVGLFAMLALMASRLASAETASHSQWWADAGIGYGTASVGKGSVTSGGGGVWIDATIGHRLNDRWMMGLELGGLGLHPSSGNYDPSYGNDSIYNEALTHLMLATRYEPKVDRGWVWSLAAGPAFYDNEAIQSVTGRYNSGNGWAGMAGVGYDWKVGHRYTHVEALLNAEYGHISLNAPFVGQFDYSTIAASVHVALH